MRRVSAFLVLLCLRVFVAAQPPAKPPTQTPPDSSTQTSSTQPVPAVPLLSPQAAFDQANLPVDITRRDTQNWSDIELAALGVAVAQARDACVARQSQTYAGADLIGYARLCAFGKQWPATYLAATTYINSPGPKPLLADAYAYEVQADLNMGREKPAEATCIAMLRSVPYTSLTDDVTSTAIRFLQFAYLPDALDLAFQREPYIMDILRAAKSASSSQPAVTPQPAPSTPQLQPTAATATDIPLHTLFEHALVLPALQQYNKDPDRAATELADLDHAMPASLPSDEAIFIAADRRQYALLGTRFPALPEAVSLLPTVGTPPAQPHLGQSTIFLLFPPWCAQCIRQAKDIVPTLLREGIVSGSDDKLHIYALLADNPPPAPKPTTPHTSSTGVRRSSQSGKSSADKSSEQATVTVTEGKPPTAEEQLRKTPTLVVAPSTLADFNASDFPFLIAVDHNGIIRLMVPAGPKNSLAQGGPAEQISDTILQHWPAPPSH